MANPTTSQNKEIDCLSPEAQRLAEARLAAKRAARAEAREIRMKELERQQKEVEERPEKDFSEKGSRNLPSLSAATLASLGGTSTRRGSGDTSVSVDTEASMREIKDSLAEVEEKYKKAMVSNAQLDNEKTNYMYQVDTLKDTLLELEEQLAESRRLYEEKSKEFEREKHAHGLLRFQLAETKAALQQREEMLQKHGIILSSEAAANGETSDTPTSAGRRGPTRTTKEELNALQTAGDGPLGKATKVEVKSGIVDNVGKREILQNAEREQHQEDPGEDGADTEVVPPRDSAEDQRPSDNSTLSLATVANTANEDQVQSQVLANTSVLEHAEQAGSGEVTSTPDAGAGASECWRELGGDTRQPEAERGGWDALDPLNRSGESAEIQKQEKQDRGTGLGEAGPEPHQEPAPSQISEVDTVRCTQGSVQAGPTGSAGPEGTVASRPPRGSVDSMSQGDRGVADVPREGDASTGCGLEAELTSQEAAEPREAPVRSTGLGACRGEEQAGGTGLKNEKPAQTEVQTSPSSAAATRRVQDATGPRTADAKSEPLEAREPGEDSNDPQGEGPDSPQKKTKNKKKKNKKKKSAAPAETGKDAKKELPSQSPDPSEVKEEEPARVADEKPGAGAPNEAPGGPGQSSVPGSSENQDAPESADVEMDGKLSPGDGDTDAEAGKAIADGEPALPEGDAVQAWGSGAGTGGSEGGTDSAHRDGPAPCRPPGGEDVPPSAGLGDQRPSEDINGESQGVREVSESLGPESNGLAPTEEPGDPCSDSREEVGAQSEKDKSKEDCTLS